ncbi:MAG TPA: vWA domain-containing protein, partial [Candidatus Nitrosotenuis sp.]|nr:vWA domain-containing protein [Candidatus Nitrosotenuis sp.]
QGQQSGQSQAASGSKPEDDKKQQGAGEGQDDLPPMTEEEARDLARRVIEQMDKEMSDKLESKQEDLKRGGQPQPGQKGKDQGQGNKAEGQRQNGQGQQAGQGQQGNQANQGQKNQGHQQGDIHQQNQSQGQEGGSTEHGRGTSDIQLPDLEDLIRMKQELEAKYEAMKSDYDRYYGPIAPYADELAGELKNFLHENTRPKFKRELFESGRKLDMRAAMQAEARYEISGQFDPDLWMRRNNPTRRGYEFVFVVDESGSMRGSDKWKHAIQALILGGEALDALEIEFGVIGFSDQPLVHKELKDKYTQESRTAMLNALESSPGGGTNDSDAVELAIDMIKRKGDPDKQKIIIVITDGEGKEEELKRQIALAKEARIHVIGVGVGPGMEHVQEVYPEGLVVDRISKLPMELAELIRAQIEGERDSFA